MGFAKIKGNLSSRVNRPVRFSAPQDVEAKKGKPVHGAIEDEVWANESINNSPVHRQPCKRGSHCWGDYSFCSQLIRWNEPSEDGLYSIRLAYYRRRCGEDYWEFAGQTTSTSDCETIRNWLEATLRKTAWFRKL
jgi:hypothetical protein